jgi:hypothetical protein
MMSQVVWIALATGQMSLRGAPFDKLRTSFAEAISCSLKIFYRKGIATPPEERRRLAMTLAEKFCPVENGWHRITKARRALAFVFEGGEEKNCRRVSVFCWL